ncbi:MAG TPA: tRNA pseudouridine(55) synthase TruB [Candidatus Blautia faecipullorum]|nr:tRNA pseudouridine(55) synthase TruB [Candidatus Blautia faecipullorum]
MDGVLIVRKEKGFTSHDVVAKLRGILRMKKIGHTGTLDPEAEGVLPVVLGKATKLVELLTEKEKTYEVVMRLGLETDTQDMTGTVLQTFPVSVTEEQVIKAAESFLGERQQIPPMYSAIKVNGKKLYELAREGKAVERKARNVHFYEIKVLETALPEIRMTVTCSKGTYIRTLCYDIGRKLGCGACMKELLRTRSGQFTLEDSLTLEEIQTCMDQGKLQEHIRDIQEILGEYPLLRCTEEADRLLLNGNALSGDSLTEQSREGWVRMCTSQGDFVGLYQWNRDSGSYRPVKMFL